MPKKRCLNPECNANFTPGHYGERQLICGKPDCLKWYKVYWSETAPPPRGMPPETYEKIRKAVERDARMHSLIVSGRESGMRKCELLGLSWTDVLGADGEIKGVIAIRGQWKDAIRSLKLPKTKQPRPGFLTERARRAIQTWREELEKAKKFIPTSRIWAVSESWVWKFFIAIQRPLGIKNPTTGHPYRFHDLRHTLARKLVKEGKIAQAKKALGHKRIETTMRYGDQSNEDLLKDLEG